eukprot:2493350-Prymnesium_polylepis.1
MEVNLAATLCKLEDHVVLFNPQSGHTHIADKRLGALLKEGGHDVRILVERLPAQRLELISRRIGIPLCMDTTLTIALNCTHVLGEV